MELTIPFELEAERAVLGAILVNNECFLDVAAALSERDFYRQAHRRIYRSMHKLAARSQAIDTLTLMSELRNDGALEDVGGPAYIASLADGVPRSTNVEHYSKIVKSTATRAALMEAAHRIMVRAQAGTDEDSALFEYAQSELLKLADGAKSDFLTPGQFTAHLTKLISEMAEGRPARGVRTGFRDVDALVPLMRPGNLVLIAGRPSMGKTAFALNLAQNIAMGHNEAGVQEQVAFFSLEMERDELGIRMAASRAGVNALRISTGTTDEDETQKVCMALVDLSASGFHVDDSPSLGLFDVRSKLRRLKARHGLGAGIIDYMQLMQTSKAENRNVEIAHLSRGLKLTAKELGIPIIALSQLSRESERRQEKRPVLADLRDSGALEQDADIVMFVHRPEVYEPDNTDVRGITEIIVGKQRNGPVGTARLVWRKEQQRFADLYED